MREISDIEKIQSLCVIPLINELIESNDKYYKTLIQSTLINLGKLSIKPLIERLDGNNLSYCNDVEYILFKIGETEAPTLISYLNYPTFYDNDTICDTICMVLSRIGGPSIKYLVEKLRTPFYPKGRISDTLISIGEIVINPILNDFKDEEWDDKSRSHIVTIFNGLGAAKTIKPVINSIKDESLTGFKREFIENIIVNQDKQASDALLEVIANTNDNKTQIIAGSMLEKMSSIIVSDVLQFLGKGNEKPVFTKKQYSAEDLYKMSASELHRGIAQILEKMGYDVEQRPLSRDQGADLIATRNGFNRYAIQIKNEAKKASNSTVQESSAAKPHFFCTGAITIANNYFTNPAIKLAISNKVALIDRDGLLDMIASDPKKINLENFFIRIN